jgi:glycosyltransferase involved in cell wall biosynthesis
VNGDSSPFPDFEPRSQSRTLTLEIPEALYRALERFAAQAGQSPETVGATWLIDAIERLANVPGMCPMGLPQTGVLDRPTPITRISAEAPPHPARGEPTFEAVGEPRPLAAPHPATSVEGAGIVWEGPQLGLHSYAQVNREFCLRLIERGHELSLIPSKIGDPPARAFPGQSLLEGRFHRSVSRPITMHVRHQWPPSFAPPPAGHWVIVQPWEFGSVPRSWVDPMTRAVDEVWAYTRFVRDCYVSGGVPADRVHVVPLGVDPRRFHPGAPPFPLKTAKPFKFLFVGGTIHRKGIDLLLEAYAETFTAYDPVCLVVKDMGGTSFYRGQTAAERIRQIQSQAATPEIEYLDQELSGDKLAGLYTACDCLVHPYRGEGFGLPIAEAMASGLPVIVTGQGAALDYCNEENAFLIPARIMRFREKRIDDLETVDYPWLAEPDPAVLQDLLRAVVDRPAAARAKGRVAAAYIRAHLTWDHAVDVLEARLEQLRQQPIRRFTATRGTGADGLVPIPKPISTGSTAIEANPMTRPRVSLCMIVKNEEAHLPTCLGTAADLVDEIVVVDTGSTDATVAVASRWGARVYPFKWVDSFAVARNESLQHAQGDWIFWLDGDESLDAENRLKLRALLAGLKDDNAAYIMSQRSTAAPGSNAAVVVDQVRLFRRLPEARWSYRVHEQILPALRRTGVDLRRSDVVIQHAGHEDAELRRRKLERDLRLLLMENDERPDDPFTLFNLGALYHETNRPADALPLLQRSLERSRLRDSIVPKLHALIAGCLRRLQRPREALDACRTGRQQAPNDELLFLEALILRELGDASAAESTLLNLLGTSTSAGFANGDDGLRGYKARHNLAVIYEETGRAAEAETQWLAAVAENPQFTPGWFRLGELCLKQERWAELESIARGLEAAPAGGEKARALRSRALQARTEIASGGALGAGLPTPPAERPALGAGLPTPPTGRPKVSPPSTSSRPASKPRVSLCMIVKNEEATLAACLASVADLVDEMIVVDTGSTDRTRDVAVQGGARVVDFAWVDDFSAARNESIRHATGDWILWLDADEQLDAANREKLRNLFSRLKWDNAAYLMQQLSTTDDPYGSRVAVDHVRLFRRDPVLRWEYRVHEQILLSIRRAGHDLRRTDVVINHVGYQAPASSELKLKRNLPLLLRQNAERPDDPITLYHLGQANQRLGRATEALPLLRRSLELLPPDYSIRPRLFASIARVHESLAQKAEALAVCRAGREQYPDVEELLFLEASLLHDMGELAEAEARLLHLLQVPTGGQLVAGDTGRRGYKARHLLAEVYRRQHRPGDAEAQWRIVVEAQPRFVPAWQGLGELYLSQGRWADLDDVESSLERVNEPEAAALKARAQRVRNEPGAENPLRDPSDPSRS